MFNIKAFTIYTPLTIISMSLLLFSISQSYYYIPHMLGFPIDLNKVRYIIQKCTRTHIHIVNDYIYLQQFLGQYDSLGVNLSNPSDQENYSGCNFFGNTIYLALVVAQISNLHTIQSFSNHFSPRSAAFSHCIYS